ncbi:MAG: MFS transporter [Jatrophihabitans sp.]|uniref:MFS transporter n=1 Tax=Jatrophihabitans sp. TaxID=1932789 RepID=UPI003F7DC961
MTTTPIVRRGPALATLLLVLFLTFLDTTIVSVTLGDMESDLAAGVIPLQWVINAYALVFASLMLTLGSLGDRFGRRRLMLIGIVIFCVGSVLCAVAPSVGWVIAGRAVMGVGAAASEPGTLSLIRQLYPERRERARALGAWSAVSGLALASGPVVGGLLVGLDGWRAVFWFNLALSVVLLVAVVTTVPESRDPQAGRIDLAGFVLGTLGIGAVIYAVIAGENNGYGTAWVVALFVVGVAALVAFVPVERRVAAPMLDLGYLRRPVVAVALVAAFAVYLGVFALFFLTALFLDIGLQYSGWKLAGAFAPMAAAIVVGGIVAGRWVARRGSRTPMVVGCVLGAVGMLVARLVVGGLHIPGCGKASTTAGCDGTFGAAFPLLLIAMAVAGFGFGVTVVPLTSAVLGHIPARLSGMAASATNTARQLGAVTGVAVLGAIVNASLKAEVIRSTGGLLIGSRGSILSILETGGSGDTLDLRAIPANYLVAFRHGLELSLVVALVVIAIAAVLAAIVREPASAEGQDEPSDALATG